MAFNEDNVTEQMCIEVAKEAGYEYCNADELREAKSDIIVEHLLQQALIKINHITLSEAQIVIQKVKDTIYQGFSGDIGPRPGAKTIYIDAETNETSSTMAAESAKPYGED
jgi:type I restriction enzyme R subunit